MNSLPLVKLPINPKSFSVTDFRRKRRVFCAVPLSEPRTGFSPSKIALQVLAIFLGTYHRPKERSIRSLTVAIIRKPPGAHFFFDVSPRNPIASHFFCILGCGGDFSDRRDLVPIVFSQSSVYGRSYTCRGLRRYRSPRSNRFSFFFCFVGFFFSAHYRIGRLFFFFFFIFFGQPWRYIVPRVIILVCCVLFRIFARLRC